MFPCDSDSNIVSWNGFFNILFRHLDLTPIVWTKTFCLISLSRNARNGFWLGHHLIVHSTRMDSTHFLIHLVPNKNKTNTMMEQFMIKAIPCQPSHRPIQRSSHTRTNLICVARDLWRFTPIKFTKSFYRLNIEHNYSMKELSVDRNSTILGW